uniref:Cap-specific mRNA (nucleoside-2'-O-)-methyltransferase 1 n=1 Tax=Astyanax mexicanus TaxID=7994 RepID=A0A8B9KBF2_ASTMX
MKRKSGGPDEATARKKVRQEEASSDEDEESSQRTTSQDSSQSESLSDAEDYRPSFSKPAASESSQINDASQSSSKFSMYNSVSQKLMAKMGFKEGEGLGKFGQGRKEIVEASTQRGRRGLGLTLQGFQGELNVDWQDEPEATAFEEVSWFPECSTEMPDAEELRDWMAVGERKLKIDDETEFCSENLLHLLLRCKSVFDDLEGEEMRRARTRSNPYETIRGAFFLNRAAMKMANMDHVFDYMFTNPKDSQGKPLVRDKEGELLYFGDVCAGPGGFSEYILWRRRWHSKGFGMTLKGSNDFKLEDFYAAPSELFEPYYGEGGVEGDGDITLPENISAFRNFVLENTERRGLHFLMADGVRSDDKKKILIKQKVYFFQKLLHVQRLNFVKVIGFVRHCSVQVKALAKIHAYVRDPTLSESRQADIRKECLKLWGVSTLYSSSPHLTPGIVPITSCFFSPIVLAIYALFVCVNLHICVSNGSTLLLLQLSQSISSPSCPTSKPIHHFKSLSNFNPWTMAYSKSSKRKFFFNKQTKVSTFDMHPTAVAPFHVCHQERMFWAWEEGVRVHDSQTRVDPGKLSKDHVLSFIHKHSPQLET